MNNNLNELDLNSNEIYTGSYNMVTTGRNGEQVVRAYDVEVLACEGQHLRIKTPTGRAMMVPVSAVENIAVRTSREERFAALFA